MRRNFPNSLSHVSIALLLSITYTKTLRYAPTMGNGPIQGDLKFIPTVFLLLLEQWSDESRKYPLWHQFMVICSFFIQDNILYDPIYISCIGQLNWTNSDWVYDSYETKCRLTAWRSRWRWWSIVIFRWLSVIFVDLLSSE